MHERLSHLPGTREAMRGQWILVASFATVTLLLHFLTNGRYGYWVDELYFVACGEHLDWGYVDHPPLIAGVARASRLLLGDSLFAIRFFSAVAAALLVCVTGLIARELGGRRFALILAMLCVMAAPVYLLFGNLLTMNAFEPLLWMLCAYAIILVIGRKRPSLWLLFGLVVGIGLLNKYSMVFFGFAIVVGLLLSASRTVLLSRWVVAAALITAIIFLPNLVWQANHGWPTLELLGNARMYQHQPVTLLEFAGQQILLMHPVTFPVWLLGLFFLLRSAGAKAYRALGWTYVVLFALFAAVQAKNYYLAPVYPMLFAAGAVAIERWSNERRWKWLRKAMVAAVVVGGMITAPYVLPVLPIGMVPDYMRMIGIKEPRSERREVGDLPQIFSDMLGWGDKVAAVARAYQRLSPEERTRCAIWGQDYGDAGAVDLLGAAYGLPKAISGHQNYYLWGPQGHTGEIVIVVGSSVDVLETLFEQVEVTEALHCEHCMPDKRDVPIHICRKMKIPLDEFWPQVKCYTCPDPGFTRGRE